MSKTRGVICAIPGTDYGFMIKMPEEESEEREKLEDNLKSILGVDQLSLTPLGPSSSRQWKIDNKTGLVDVPLVSGTQDDDRPEFENMGKLPSPVARVIEKINPTYFPQPDPVIDGGEMKYHCTVVIYRNKAAYCSPVGSKEEGPESIKLEEELKKTLSKWGVPPARFTKSTVRAGQPQLYFTTKPKERKYAISHFSIIGKPDREYAMIMGCEKEIKELVRAEEEYRKALNNLRSKRDAMKYELDNGGPPPDEEE